MPKQILVVLVIDDLPEVADTLSMMLRKNGMAVMLPPLSFTAEQIAELPCDAVVTDLEMTPEVSGYDVIEAVRQRRPNAPIIAFSGKGPYLPHKVGKLAGADEFLAKPFSADQLYTAIMRVMALKREARAA